MERTGKFNSIIGKHFCITKESMATRKSKAKLRKDVKHRANIWYIFRIQNELLEIYWRKKGRREGWGRKEERKKKQKRKLAENLKRKITSGHCRAQYRQNVFSLVNNLIYTNKNCNWKLFHTYQIIKHITVW